MDHDQIPAQIATLIEQGKWIKDEIKSMRLEIKDLVAFKMKLIGIGIFCGSCGTMLFEIVKEAIKK